MVLQNIRDCPVFRIGRRTYLFKEEGLMEVGSFRFEVRHTPGHSPGSVSFIFEDAHLAVVGDTLFKQSVRQN